MEAFRPMRSTWARRWPTTPSSMRYCRKSSVAAPREGAYLPSLPNTRRNASEIPMATAARLRSMFGLSSAIGPIAPDPDQRFAAQVPVRRHVVRQRHQGNIEGLVRESLAQPWRGSTDHFDQYVGMLARKATQQRREQYRRVVVGASKTKAPKDYLWLTQPGPLRAQQRAVHFLLEALRLHADCSLSFGQWVCGTAEHAGFGDHYKLRSSSLSRRMAMAINSSYVFHQRY
jgi:hypothetical protein